MSKKIIVVTGATSGLGEAAALAFAAEGATVIAVGRDASRGAQVLAALQAKNPGGAHAFERADLSRAAEARALGERLAARYPRIDALVNNAGGTFSKRQETADGVELTFALNVLGPYVLTAALASSLAGGSVVNVVTRVLPGEKLDVTDLHAKKKYSGLKAYSRAKLALEMVTIEQAKRMPGVRVNCVHPGVILGTRFSGGQGAVAMAIMSVLGKIFGFTATADQAVARFRQAMNNEATGAFFRSDNKSDYPPGALNTAAQAAVWQELTQLAGR